MTISLSMRSNRDKAHHTRLCGWEWFGLWQVARGDGVSFAAVVRTAIREYLTRRGIAPHDSHNREITITVRGDNGHHIFKSLAKLIGVDNHKSIAKE